MNKGKQIFLPVLFFFVSKKLSVIIAKSVGNDKIFQYYDSFRKKKPSCGRRGGSNE